MARVQFTETVVLPAGPGGTLIPVKGIGATPYNINPDGTEGSQATAYAGRTGNSLADSLSTNATGTVSYWLDSGDYNIHMEDPQSPPRIETYIRGFTAPVIDTTNLVIAAQNLIQFTGDTKFSLQTSDHGLKPDGTYEWLHVTNDADGGGRKIDHELYPGIHQLLGSPPPDSAGMIRLPNISGRALIASGAASGLSARNLLDFVGEEAHATSIPEMPIHSHLMEDAATGIYIVNEASGVSLQSSGTGVSVNNDNAISNSSYYAGICQDVSIYSGSMGSGQNGAAPWGCSAHNTGWVGTQMNHNHSITDPAHSHAVVDPTHSHPIIDVGHKHTLDTSGQGTAHNNIQPSACLNLFVKS